MSWRNPVGVALALALGLLIIEPGGAEATRIRPGTISFGAQTEYGFLRGGTALARAFDKGFGGELHVWYRLRHGGTVGVVFGEQIYQALPDSTAFDKTTVISAGLEFGQVFGPHQNPVYILLGAGVWTPTAFDREGVAFEGNKPDRIYLSGTLGTQIFIRRTVAIDLSLRGRLHQGAQEGYPYLATDSPSKLDREVQLGAGLHFYVLD